MRPDPESVRRLLADLDSDRFQVRQKTTAELEQLGELILPAVEQALRAKNNLEKELRVKSLHERFGPGNLLGGSPEQLRQLRAVEVLEKAGGAEARELLRRLAVGAPAARLTREARAALERLSVE